MRSLKTLTTRRPVWLGFCTIEHHVHPPASAEHLLQLSWRVLASGNGHIGGDTSMTPGLTLPVCRRGMMVPDSLGSWVGSAQMRIRNLAQSLRPSRDVSVASGSYSSSPGSVSSAVEWRS